MKTSRILLFLLLPFMALAWAQSRPDSAAMQAQLQNIAHVGTVMVDGDTCQKIVTPAAKQYMFKKDPKNPWLADDNYNVDDASFNAVKKTLIRLSHLASFPVDVNLWMPIQGHPNKIQIVIRNKYEMSQFWKWGDLYQDMVPQMATVLKTGKQVTVKHSGWISVLAPVYNSLGDAVGVIEVVSRSNIDMRQNVK